MIIAVNDKGENALYPPVDMVFDNKLNLLEYQISPAELPEKVLWKLEAVALKVVKDLKSPGIFAVEMFVDFDDNVFVNETAPGFTTAGTIPLKRITVPSSTCSGVSCLAIPWDAPIISCRPPS